MTALRSLPPQSRATVEAQWAHAGVSSTSPPPLAAPAVPSKGPYAPMGLSELTTPTPGLPHTEMASQGPSVRPQPSDHADVGSTVEHTQEASCTVLRVGGGDPVSGPADERETRFAMQNVSYLEASTHALRALREAPMAPPRLEQPGWEITQGVVARQGDVWGTAVIQTLRATFEEVPNSPNPRRLGLR